MTRRGMVILMTGLLNWTARLFGEELSGEEESSIYNVSLIQLIANPSEFNRQRLRMVGYLGRNGVDRSLGVFLSEVDGRNFILSNSVDLHIEESAIRGLVGKYVVVSGVYHAPSPRSGYNGYIDEIADITLWNAGDAGR